MLLSGKVTCLNRDRKRQGALFDQRQRRRSNEIKNYIVEFYPMENLRGICNSNFESYLVKVDVSFFLYII